MTEKIASPSVTKKIIEENAFYFKKNFGQNFLIDFNIIEKIIDSAEIDRNDFVLEIGPGIGSLTQGLAEKAKKVVVVEIDSHLIPILKNTLKDYDNVEIINEDILKADIDTIIANYCENQEIKVVANLPYYVTTPIIMNLLEKKYKIKSITIMIQKEVAQRIQAQPKTKEYGSLSIAVQYYCDAQIKMLVPPVCFLPKPKVASAVIQLEVLKKPKIDVKNEMLFFQIVKCAFGQRRKTLMNSLYNLGGFGISKEELTESILSIGLLEKVRGEELSLEDFSNLCNEIDKRKKTSDNI